MGEARLNHVSHADQDLKGLQKKLLEHLHKKLEDTPAEKRNEVFYKELENGARTLTEYFGPKSAERSIITQYSFEQLNRILLPPYTKFLLWVSIQKKDFFDQTTRADGKGPVTKSNVWSLAVHELGLSVEQEERLADHYRTEESSARKKERENLGHMSKYLSVMEAAMECNAASIQEEENKVREILSAEQFIKLQYWMSSNEEKIKSSGLKEKIKVDALAEVSQRADGLQTLLNMPPEDFTLDDLGKLLSALSPEVAQDISNTFAAQ